MYRKPEIIKFIEEKYGIKLQKFTSEKNEDFQANSGYVISEKNLITAFSLIDTNCNDVSFLKNLTTIICLCLRRNILTDISVLSELKNLTSLDLGGNIRSKAYFCRKGKGWQDYSFKGFGNLLCTITNCFTKVAKTPWGLFCREL